MVSFMFSVLEGFHFPQARVNTRAVLASALDWLELLCASEHKQKLKTWHCTQNADVSKGLAVSGVESFWLLIGIVRVKFGCGALVIVLKALSDCAKVLLLFRNTQKYFTAEISKT